MGNIIIPGHDNIQDEKQLSITWTRDDIHPELAEDLEINRKLFPKYVKAVETAVLRSLRHEDTRPNVISEALLKDRVKLCHQALVIMRFDMGMSLHQCFDKLPTKLLEALASGQRVEDLVEASRTRVHDQLDEAAEGVSAESWRRDADPVQHVLHDEDLADGVEPSEEGDEP